MKKSHHGTRDALKKKHAAQRFGVWGERFATLYYRLHGYRIIGRDVRTQFAQIDLVVAKRKERIVVEVKSRKGHLEYGYISEKQLQRLDRATRLLAARGEPDLCWSIDVLLVMPWKWPERSRNIWNFQP